MSRRTDHQRHRALRDASLPAESRVELTVERGREIVAAIASGNFPYIAAKAGGVTLTTLNRWLERGERGEEPYAKFLVAYREAEFSVESAAVQRLKDAGVEDWHADERFLAKRFPERWSEHASRLAVLGPDGAGMADLLGIQIHIHLGEHEGYGPPHAVIDLAHAAGDGVPRPATAISSDDEE
jgi:hypothetical protein